MALREQVRMNARRTCPRSLSCVEDVSTLRSQELKQIYNRLSVPVFPVSADADDHWSC